MRKVCHIFTNEYLTEVNATCGLHVHFSFGKNYNTNDEITIWTSKRLKKLMMFFWTFEPQFDTIHPDYRVNDVTKHIISIRRYSRLGLRQIEKQIPPGSRSRQGLEAIRSTKNLPQILDLVFVENHARHMAVSLWNISRVLYPGIFGDLPKPFKPTVEFREHARTVDVRRLNI